MVNFKKGCNWSRTEIKNWIATELKREECMEESGEQLRLQSSAFCSDVEVSKSLGGVGMQAPNCLGVYLMWSWAARPLGSLKKCLWVNMAKSSVLQDVSAGHPIINQFQSTDSPGTRTNCSIQLLGFVFTLFLSAILNPPSQEFEVIEQRSSFYCSNCNSRCVH